jgi:2-iminobutanoate/2-iminopropanoate deaminase
MCDCCKKEVITSNKAPKAIGPYSVGIRGGHSVYTSGQIGLDPNTGNIVDGGIETETVQALKNIEQVLLAAGTALGNIVKTTVYLTDLNNFPKMNDTYQGFFLKDPPARTTVEISALPKGALVEIDAVAMLPCSGDCK